MIDKENHLPEANQPVDETPTEMPSLTHLILGEIHKERNRQRDVEGFGPVHDDSEHSGGELLRAAACYLIKGGGPVSVEETRAIEFLWPWGGEWWKPKDRRRDIIRALALGVAELERMDRAEAKALGKLLARDKMEEHAAEGRAEMDIDGGDE